MTGSYNNFFRMFDRNLKKEVTYEASREIAKPKTLLKPRKVSNPPSLDTVLLLIFVSRVSQIYHNTSIIHV